MDKRQNFFLFRSKRQLFFNKIVKNEFLSSEKHPLVFPTLNLNHSHLKFANPKEMIFYHLSPLFDYSFPLPKISVERRLQRSTSPKKISFVCPCNEASLYAFVESFNRATKGGTRRSGWHGGGWAWYKSKKQQLGEEKRLRRKRGGKERRKEQNGAVEEEEEEGRGSPISSFNKIPRERWLTVPDVESCRHIENSSCLLFSNSPPSLLLSTLLSFFSFFLPYSLA